MEDQNGVQTVRQIHMKQKVATKTVHTRQKTVVTEIKINIIKQNLQNNKMNNQTAVL